MKKQTYIGGLLLVLLISAVSCKKGLEVDPRQSVRLEDALTSRDNVNAAILGVYARLKNLRVYGRDLVAIPEALADNGFATNKSGRLVAEANNNPGAHFANWNSAYFAIAEINLILDAVPKLNVLPVVTTAERNNWEGQLKFLRALFYFDLVKAYAYEPGQGVLGQDRGGVPFVTATPTSVEAAAANLPARAKVEDVYAAIYKDLTEANGQLINNFSSSVFPQLATKVAAQSLFARVALYNRDYTRAKAWADSAIAVVGTRLMNAGAYVNGWRTAINPESIFEVRFVNQAENNGVNESPQTTFTTLLVPGNTGLLGGFGDLVPTVSLLNELGLRYAGVRTTSPSYPNGLAFASANFGRVTHPDSLNRSLTDDVRSLLFEVGSAGRGTARVECTKFLGKNGFPNLDNIPVIRVSDLFLIRAEALSAATSPIQDLTAARADLVRIKQNRYSNYATTQQAFDNGLTTQSALFNEIIRQRRLEFAFEGHRFFDLKRLGRDIVKAPHYATLPYTDFKILPSIPVRETDNNPNLVQNFGY
jgi:hypothetical protein